MKWIVFLLTSTYFVIQSVKDAKTMQVYTVLNNIAVALSAGLYALDIAQYGISSGKILELIIVTTVILFAGLIRWYGSGDCKGMVVIYLMIRYVSPMYPYTDLALFLLALLVADIVQMIIMNIQKKKNTGLSKTADNGKVYTAYFPSMTVGYMLVAIIGML